MWVVGIGDGHFLRYSSGLADGDSDYDQEDDEDSRIDEDEPGP